MADVITIIPQIIKSSDKFASLDIKYGPYSSSGNKTALEVADETLRGVTKDMRTEGLTVGIVQNDNTIKEYWYQPIPDPNDVVNNPLVLVEKGDDMIPITTSEIDTLS